MNSPYIEIRSEQKLIDNNGELLCPLCGFAHNHMHRISLRAGEEHRDEITDLAIEIEGECGHAWTLRLTQYKGRIAVESTARSCSRESSTSNDQ